MTKTSTTKSKQDIPELKREQLGMGVCGKYLKHISQGSNVVVLQPEIQRGFPALMNKLLDAAGDDEEHPLSNLLDLVSDMVSQYEQTHHAIEAAEPNDTLRFLIEARGLKPEDLSELVPQSNLSAILAGKRKISATLAGQLGKFFGVSPALFVPQ